MKVKKLKSWNCICMYWNSNSNTNRYRIWHHYLIFDFAILKSVIPKSLTVKYKDAGCCFSGVWRLTSVGTLKNSKIPRYFSTLYCRNFCWLDKKEKIRFRIRFNKNVNWGAKKTIKWSRIDKAFYGLLTTNFWKYVMRLKLLEEQT